MSKTTTEFRYVGQVPDELTGGQPLAPEQTVKLTDAQQADPHNWALIDGGQLIPTTTKGVDAK